MRSFRTTLTLLDRLVLASFVLCPMTRHEQGRQAKYIVQTAPYAFRKVTRKFDRSIISSMVATACRGLEKRGYLMRTGTIPVTFTILFRYRMPGQVQYNSPMFRLTESGMLAALSFVDHAHLPDVKPGFWPKKKAYRPTIREFIFRHGYVPIDYHASIFFLRSVGIEGVAHYVNLD